MLITLQIGLVISNHLEDLSKISLLNNKSSINDTVSKSASSKDADDNFVKTSRLIGKKMIQDKQGYFEFQVVHAHHPLDFILF